ncbi:glycosyl hydrolase family 28-related protein [Terrihabitans sp. B22-R8]|uniref:glycosyl hydrolase family 28-related protein n=1 Tax=Terrihabitans sp. B22-R8 TaxID=3425128 RepID=UPI00403CE313
MRVSIGAICGSILVSCSASILHSFRPLRPGDGQTRRNLAASGELNVKSPPFNARGDGMFDDRPAIQSAIDTVHGAGGGSVYLPAGIYVIGPEPGDRSPGGLQMRSNVLLRGDAPGASVLKLRNACHRTLLYGPDNVDELWGRGSENGLQNWSLANLELDGNRATNADGDGLRIYGFRPNVENLNIRDVAGHGWRTEWASYGSHLLGMEGLISNVRIDNCGRHGMWFSGPHDSVLTNVIVIDSSRDAHARFDGFHLTGSVSSRFVTCHAWNRAEGNRMRHALSDEAGGNDFIGCQFEGAYRANFQALGQGSVLVGCRMFAAANGIGVIVRSSEIVMRGCVIGPPLEGAPPSRGILLGQPGDWVAACDLDLFAREQELGLVDFTHSSGSNSLKIRGFNGRGIAYAGRPHPSDEVDLLCSGDGGGSLRQRR